MRPELFEHPLQLWGGHECTVNRVKDRWYDQSIRTGHEDRTCDLGRFAALGLKALRYPVLWERISPETPDKADWRWTDERLTGIRRLGMTPIAGLVHHGSGPRYTHLLDDSFAPGLARHAAAVAERYPWIEAYTPVNEPLTTARFSALYGHWYPHARDEGAFFAALLNEIDATRLSMKSIRRVNPNARLIQTEDLGYTFATPPLAHQAAYENERRWLCWDLLTGKLDPESPMTRRMENLGLGDRVKAILDDPCPPDVIGVNHYLSSERLLDHRQDRYPRHTWGGNAREPYADVEAVRAVAPGPLGLERLLDQTWDRYGLPMAVTECHNGCTRDEQMRWLMQTWQTAQRLRERGVPVEAVTVWSLLGSIDWNSLLTKGSQPLRGGRLRHSCPANAPPHRHGGAVSASGVRRGRAPRRRHRPRMVGARHPLCLPAGLAQRRCGPPTPLARRPAGGSAPAHHRGHGHARAGFRPRLRAQGAGLRPDLEGRDGPRLARRHRRGAGRY